MPSVNDANVSGGTPTEMGLTGWNSRTGCVVLGLQRWWIVCWKWVVKDFEACAMVCLHAWKRVLSWSQHSGSEWGVLKRGTMVMRRVVDVGGMCCCSGAVRPGTRRWNATMWMFWRMTATCSETMMGLSVCVCMSRRIRTTSLLSWGMSTTKLRL